MTELEKYYNESFKRPGDPAFSDLPKITVKVIAGSFGFAAWKVRQALDVFGKAVSRAVSNDAFKLRGRKS